MSAASTSATASPPSRTTERCAEEHAAALDGTAEPEFEARFHGGSFRADGFDGDPGRLG